MNARRFAPLALVVVVAAAYPLAVVAGGAPRFPSRAECIRPALADGDLEVVFGRFGSRLEASTLLSRVLGVGFQGSEIEPDGCGRLKVAVHGISTLKVGAEVIAEARSVGLTPSLEAR